MQVRVLLLLSLALVCHWLSGNALAATAPVFFFAITTFLWHFHPSVARSRLGPVAAARFLSVVLTIAAWDAAVAFVVLSAAKAAAQAAGIDAAGAFRPEDAAPYGVLALPAAIALKRPGPELDWLCRLLVGVMYDVPMHLVVVRASGVACVCLLRGASDAARARASPATAATPALFAPPRPPRPAPGPQIAYWAVGWRLNSLATPVSSGEVLLGALPYESDAAALRGRGVTGVVNLCREWRGPTRRYATLGIEQHHIPTADGDMPSLADAAAVRLRFGSRRDRAPSTPSRGRPAHPAAPPPSRRARRRPCPS